MGLAYTYDYIPILDSKICINSKGLGVYNGQHRDYAGTIEGRL